MGTPKENPAGQPERHRRSNSELVRKAIENIEEKLEANDVKATIGDFIRLLQLEKELEEDQPRDIKATWVASEKNASEE